MEHAHLPDCVPLTDRITNKSEKVIRLMHMPRAVSLSLNINAGISCAHVRSNEINPRAVPMVAL